MRERRERREVKWKRDRGAKERLSERWRRA